MVYVAESSKNSGSSFMMMREGGMAEGMGGQDQAAETGVMAEEAAAAAVWRSQIKCHPVTLWRLEKQ